SGATRQIQAPAIIYPRNVFSRSTSSAIRLRLIATTRPSPTTTSDAATAMTATANTWPAPSPRWRAYPIRARFPPLSMISSESRTIRGLRRSRTPSAPVQKRNAATARYQATSGPSIAGLLPSGVRAEDHAADRRDEQHDRRHLEREQVIREEEAADLRRAA